MKKYQRQSGFTIIETLVAITILMISIVGPLTIASKGLLAAAYARDQIIASYLAQDGIEYIKNIRDNNIIQHNSNSSIDWLRGLSSCTVASPCSIDTINGIPSTPTGIGSCSDTASCALYLKSVSCNAAPYCGYTPNNGGGARKTQFSRYFYITPKSSGGGNQAGADAEASLVVRVWWNTGSITNEIIYEDELFNISQS